MATATWKHYAKGDKWRSKGMLHGMTNKPAADLVPLAKSWLKAPKLQLGKGFLGLFASPFISEGYDQTQGAYILSCKKPGKPSKLKLKLAARRDCPVVNPAFVVKGWGESDAELKLNGKKIKCALKPVAAYAN
jgi:hypothetical protein